MNRRRFLSLAGMAAASPLVSGIPLAPATTFFVTSIETVEPTIRVINPWKPMRPHHSRIDVLYGWSSPRLETRIPA